MIEIALLYTVCCIYNNILINANNTEYFIFVEEVFFDEYFGKKDIELAIMYFCFLPLASIVISYFWIKEEIIK